MYLYNELKRVQRLLLQTTSLKQLFLISILVAPLLCYSQTPESEYADKVITSHYSNANPYFTGLYGGEGYNFPISIDPRMIEGANNSFFVSLPTGSWIILEFTDNMIIDYPGQNDIFVTENGCNNEQADVYVSNDGKKFTKLGTVDDCYVSSLDLGTIGYKDPVKFVKIVGLDLNGGSPGFDLVNVKGLPKSSVDVVEDVVDAVADSLDNLSEFGFTTANNENAAGKEWVIESESLNNAELVLYDPDKNKVSIHFRSIEPNKVVIDVSGFKKGTYILEIKTGTNTIKQKINIV